MVLLCESRFGKQRVQDGLSLWLRPYVCQFAKFGVANQALTRFFRTTQPAVAKRPPPQIPAPPAARRATDDLERRMEERRIRSSVEPIQPKKPPPSLLSVLKGGKGAPTHDRHPAAAAAAAPASKKAWQPPTDTSFVAPLLSRRNRAASNASFDALRAACGGAEVSKPTVSPKELHQMAQERLGPSDYSVFIQLIKELKAINKIETHGSAGFVERLDKALEMAAHLFCTFEEPQQATRRLKLLEAFVPFVPQKLKRWIEEMCCLCQTQQRELGEGAHTLAADKLRAIQAAAHRWGAGTEPPAGTRADAGVSVRGTAMAMAASSGASAGSTHAGASASSVAAARAARNGSGVGTHAGAATRASAGASASADTNARVIPPARPSSIGTSAGTSAGAGVSASVSTSGTFAARGASNGASVGTRTGAGASGARMPTMQRMPQQYSGSNGTSAGTHTGAGASARGSMLQVQELRDKALRKETSQDKTSQEKTSQEKTSSLETMRRKLKVHEYAEKVLGVRVYGDFVRLESELEAIERDEEHESTRFFHRADSIRDEGARIFSSSAKHQKLLKAFLPFVPRSLKKWMMDLVRDEGEQNVNEEEKAAAGGEQKHGQQGNAQRGHAQQGHAQQENGHGGAQKPANASADAVASSSGSEATKFMSAVKREVDNDALYKAFKLQLKQRLCEIKEAENRADQAAPTDALRALAKLMVDSGVSRETSSRIVKFGGVPAGYVESWLQIISKAYP